MEPKTTTLPAALNYFEEEAKYNNQIKFTTLTGKLLWKGIGNTSGLYEYAREVLVVKWDKKGANFMKKIEAYLKGGGVVLVYYYRYANRDRGNWIQSRALKINLDVSK